MEFNREQFRKFANKATWNRYLIFKQVLKGPQPLDDITEAMRGLDERDGWIGDIPDRKVGKHEITPTAIRDHVKLLVREGLLSKLPNHNQGGEYDYDIADKGKVQGLINEDSEGISELFFWGQIFEKYNGLPLFSQIHQYLKENRELIAEDNVKAFRVVDFETSDYGDAWKHRDDKMKDVNAMSQMEHLLFSLYYNIRDRERITFTFHGFEGSNEYDRGRKFGKEEVREENFDPYILKEVMGRWYLYGWSNVKTGFQHYALERIVLDDVLGEFKRKKEFDPEAIWKHSAGITCYGEPVRVEFKLKDGPVYNNIQYLNSVPIMPGGMQKVHDKRDARGFVKVVLNKVHIGPELVRKIRAFGLDNVKDVKPAWLDEDLREKGKTDTVTFKCKLKKGETEGDLKTYLEENLRIYSGGDSENAAVHIKPKRNAVLVTVKGVLVNSTLAYFAHRLYREKRLVGNKNAYEIFKKKYLK